MKNFLIGAVVVALVVGVVVKIAHSGTKQDTCARIESLCGGLSDEKLDMQECRRDIDEIQKIVGKDAVSHAEDCVESANSCVEAAGCIAGSMKHAVDDFERAFDRASH